MKVTRTIREFIENQIRSKAEESLAELKKRADEATEEYYRDASDVDKQCCELVNALYKKYNITNCVAGRNCAAAYNLPEVKEYEKARSNAYNKISRIVTEIAATMELGGTKAELLEMINNVTF